LTALRGLPPIISRPGAADTLPYELQGEVLLVTDQGVADAGLLAKLSHSNWSTLVQESGEPTHEVIDELAAYLREHSPDWVVGLGGGSVMDVVKLAACVAGSEHSANTYAEGAPLPNPHCKRAMIPTTAGTGSEVTRTSVFKDVNGRKTWAWGDGLGCEMVILDSEFTVGMPHHITCLSGMDAVAHALEAFMSPRCCEFASSFCLQALSLAGTHLPVVLNSPRDMKARQGMMVASLFAGVGIDLCGTGIAHAAAHAAATVTGSGHAAGVIWAMPTAIFWNLPHAGERYARAARSLASDSFTSIMQAWRGLLVHGGEIPVPEGLDAQNLKQALQSPENASMLSNNARQVGPGDLDELVELLLEQS
jgi:alcohol dehydrogenase class IV